MTRDNIIRMAREAGLIRTHYTGRWDAQQNELEQFAALVAAAERDAFAVEALRVTFELVNESQRAVQEAVDAEREACAALAREHNAFALESLILARADQLFSDWEDI